MEPNAPAPPPGPPLFDMEIDPMGQGYLNNVSKWGKFVAITALVFVALCLIGLAVAYQDVVDGLAKLFAFSSSAAGVLLTVVFVICGLAVISLVYLLRACIMIKQGLVSQNVDRVADGFRSLKAVFTISIIFSALSLLGTIITLIK